MKTETTDKGYYVMGQYTSSAWFPTKEEAQKEVNRLVSVGLWGGVKPYVEKA